MGAIGELIHKRRKELDLTLEEVGDAVGVGKSTVRKWENGMIKNMGRDKIAALARVLQIRPVDLVPGEVYDEIDLTTDEREVVMAYRKADPVLKAGIRKMLDLPEAKKITEESAIS